MPKRTTFKVLGSAFYVHITLENGLTLNI